VPNDPSEDAEASLAPGLEDEVAQLRQLIRMIGHEIGNSLGPIGSLLGSARTIVARQADAPPEPAGAATARAGRAPGEVLATARLDLVLRTAAERAGHLQSFLQECVRLTRLPDPRPTAADWGAIADRLRVLWPGLAVDLPDVRRPARFDVAQVEQVLVNLIKNAYEAGGPPEEVRVQIEPSSSGPGPGAGTTVSVLDRGRGASELELEAMARGGFSTKPAGGGVGLGVCRALVERHGGRLNIERRSGGGMAVSFWLPDTSRPRR
jgi:signal transduction histidine kinase